MLAGVFDKAREMAQWHGQAHTPVREPGTRDAATDTRSNSPVQARNKCGRAVVPNSTRKKLQLSK